MMTDRERKIRRLLRNEFPRYAKKCLSIRPAGGGAPAALVLNRSQKILHERIEEQRRRTGRVRAIVLKGRKMGVSTYVGARFFHKVTHRRGVQVYILTHQQKATDTLFGMVERFYKNLPELIRPALGESNANAMAFPLLDSDYSVGTAGTKGTGRSQTIQLFHGSEVAFWQNAPTHFAGVVQAVTKADDTEIILESTANGMGDEFHQRWRDAETGKSEFAAIFLPWFWDDRYQTPVGKDFILDHEEVEYAETYQLTLEQMAWRRNTIVSELRDPLLFKQEYPATAAEAFQMSGHDSFIRPDPVVKARRFTCNGVGPLIIGADPARFGDDRFALAFRRGRKIEKIESKGKLDTVAGANWLKRIIDTAKPKRVFIDVGGIGAGCYDLLISWGYGEEHSGEPHGGPVRAVNFGGEPVFPTAIDESGQEIPGPRNRRAEMWMQSRDWLNDVAGVDIPDIDSLQADACAPGYHYDTSQRLLLESKEHMRARGVSSPDEWDAVALTFAEPVAPDRPVRKEQTRRSPWAV